MPCALIINTLADVLLPSLSRLKTGLITDFTLFGAKIRNINETSKKNNKNLRVAVGSEINVLL
jgi:predicted SpoU family rRNA methylase